MSLQQAYLLQALILIGVLLIAAGAIVSVFFFFGRWVLRAYRKKKWKTVCFQLVIFMALYTFLYVILYSHIFWLYRFKSVTKIPVPENPKVYLTYRNFFPQFNYYLEIRLTKEQTDTLIKKVVASNNYLADNSIAQPALQVRYKNGYWYRAPAGFNFVQRYGNYQSHLDIKERRLVLAYNIVF